MPNLLSRLFNTKAKKKQEAPKKVDEKPLLKQENTKIPKYSGKVSVDALSEIPKKLFSPSLLNLEEEVLFYKETALPLEFLWRPKKGANRVFIFFSGDAQRKKNNPPVFQRWSWASKMPGHSIFISDPALYLNDTLGLAWYAGTQNMDISQEIAHLLTQISEEINIPLKDFVLYGSSGGGYAALKISTLLEAAQVIAINPQTNILKYNQYLVEKYLRDAWELKSRKSVEDNDDFRFSLLHERTLKKLKQRRIIYIQNTFDSHHFEEHFLPFCTKYQSIEGDEHIEALSTLLFSDKAGHSKAESQEVFDRAMRLLDPT